MFKSGFRTEVFSMKELGLFRKALHGRKVVFWFGFGLLVWFFNSYSLLLFSELSTIQLAVKTH